jgi:uncharacterized protein YycO
MKIYIRFKKGEHDINSKLIKFWTKSEYSHVEIIINNNSYDVDTSCGVRKYISISKDIESWDIISIDVDISEENFKKIERFIENQVGLKYDWRGIFLSQFINFGIDSDTKWFCSEFVTKILQLFLIEETLDIKPNKVSHEKLSRLLSSYK